MKRSEKLKVISDPTVLDARECIRNGYGSQGLREKLQSYSIVELTKIYYKITDWDLEKDERYDKQKIIELIVNKALSICNQGWVFAGYPCPPFR